MIKDNKYYPLCCQLGYQHMICMVNWNDEKEAKAYANYITASGPDCKNPQLCDKRRPNPSKMRWPEVVPFNQELAARVKVKKSRSANKHA